MTRIIISLGIIFGSLLCGYCYRCRIIGQEGQSAEVNLALLRKKLQIFAFFFLIPLASMLSLWGLPHPDPHLLVLPVLGVSAWSFGGILALIFARVLKLNRVQTGSFYCCGTFANVVAIGTLVCVCILGDESIAMVALYRLGEDLFFYGIALPVAQRYSTSAQVVSFARSARVLIMPCIILIALLCGIALNLLGIARPEFCADLASVTTVVATFCALFAIGLGLRFALLPRYLQPTLVMCGLKFIILPLVISSIAFALGLAYIGDGLPLKVAIILSAMPVAMNALIPPSLFALDLDLANACWIGSTVALVVVVPILLLIVSML